MNGDAISRNGYSPAYPSSSPSAATISLDVAQDKEEDVGKDKEQDSWSGVKSLLTSFVGDFNRHIAETFGEHVGGFELSVAEEKERSGKIDDEAKEVEKLKEVEKFVHHTVFCDRCLSVLPPPLLSL